MMRESYNVLKRIFAVLFLFLLFSISVYANERMAKVSFSLPVISGENGDVIINKIYYKAISGGDTGVIYDGSQKLKEFEVPINSQLCVNISKLKNQYELAGLSIQDISNNNYNDYKAGFREIVNIENDYNDNIIYRLDIKTEGTYIIRALCKRRKIKLNLVEDFGSESTNAQGTWTYYLDDESGKDEYSKEIPINFDSSLKLLEYTAHDGYYIQDLDDISKKDLSNIGAEYTFDETERKKCTIKFPENTRLKNDLNIKLKLKKFVEIHCNDDGLKIKFKSKTYSKNEFKNLKLKIDDKIEIILREKTWLLPNTSLVLGEKNDNYTQSITIKKSILHLETTNKDKFVLNIILDNKTEFNTDDLIKLNSKNINGEQNFERDPKPKLQFKVTEEYKDKIKIEYNTSDYELRKINQINQFDREFEISKDGKINITILQGLYVDFKKFAEVENGKVEYTYDGKRQLEDGVFVQKGNENHRKVVYIKIKPDPNYIAFINGKAYMSLEKEKEVEINESTTLEDLKVDFRENKEICIEFLKEKIIGVKNLNVKINGEDYKCIEDGEVKENLSVKKRLKNEIKISIETYPGYSPEGISGSESLNSTIIIPIEKLYDKDDIKIKDYFKINELQPLNLTLNVNDYFKNNCVYETIIKKPNDYSETFKVGKSKVPRGSKINLTWHTKNNEDSNKIVVIESNNKILGSWIYDNGSFEFPSVKKDNTVFAIKLIDARKIEIDPYKIIKIENATVIIDGKENQEMFENKIVPYKKIKFNIKANNGYYLQGNNIFKNLQNWGHPTDLSSDEINTSEFKDKNDKELLKAILKKINIKVIKR